MSEQVLIENPTVKQIAAVTGVDQRQLADLTGLSQGHLSRIFSGATYGTSTAIKIGKVINKSWQEVFSMLPPQLYQALAEKVEAPNGN